MPFDRTPYRLLFALFSLASLALCLGAAGCTAGRTLSQGEADVTLDLPLDPAALALFPAFPKPADDTRLKPADYQFGAGNVYFNLVDLATGAPVLPASREAGADRLRVTGPFAGTRLALRATNSGDIVEKTFPASGKDDLPVTVRALIGTDDSISYFKAVKDRTITTSDFTDKKSWFLVLGAIPPGAAGTLAGGPVLDASTLTASYLFLNRHDATGALPLSAPFATFAIDAPAASHSVKRIAADLDGAIAVGYFNEKMPDLNGAIPAEARLLLFRRTVLKGTSPDISYDSLYAGGEKFSHTPVIDTVTPTTIARADLASTEFIVSGANFGTAADSPTIVCGALPMKVVEATDTVLRVIYNGGGDAGAGVFTWRAGRSFRYETLNSVQAVTLTVTE